MDKNIVTAYSLCLSISKMRPKRIYYLHSALPAEQVLVHLVVWNSQISIDS